MGHKVFEPLIKKDMGSDDLSKKQVFYIKTKNGSVNAKMIRTVEGYVVLKGSKIRESDTKSTPSWAKKKRKQLISEGTIKNGVFLRNRINNVYKNTELRGKSYEKMGKELLAGNYFNFNSRYSRWNFCYEKRAICTRKDL